MPSHFQSQGGLFTALLFRKKYSNISSQILLSSLRKGIWKRCLQNELFCLGYHVANDNCFELDDADIVYILAHILEPSDEWRLVCNLVQWEIIHPCVAISLLGKGIKCTVTFSQIQHHI